MPRTPGLLNSSEPTVYHLMSRTALQGYPMEDVENEKLLKIIQRYSAFHFVDVLGFCLMGNHFHLVVRVYPESCFDLDAVNRRITAFYGEDRDLTEYSIEQLRLKMADVSEYMKGIKQAFSVFFNRRHSRTGSFWGSRFKSVMVQEGETLINLLAYVELNPIRAGLVRKPEDYRWCSLAWHIQTGNKESFLKTEFGLHARNRLSETERLTMYRKYVYEAGAIGTENGKMGEIPEKVIRKEKKKGFSYTRTDRFRYRTKYFTDSGIIGTKDFVATHTRRLKHLFTSTAEKKPKPIKSAFPGQL